MTAKRTPYDTQLTEMEARGVDPNSDGFEGRAMRIGLHRREGYLRAKAKDAVTIDALVAALEYVSKNLFDDMGYDPDRRQTVTFSDERVRQVKAALALARKEEA